MSDQRRIVEYPTESIVVVRMDPNKITLPVDAVSEMTKDFVLINNIIALLKDDMRQEIETDDEGNRRTRSILNPSMIHWMRLKRDLINDLWKMAGGEVQQQIMKEKAAIVGKILFQEMKKMSKEELEELKGKWRSETVLKD